MERERMICAKLALALADTPGIGVLVVRANPGSTTYKFIQVVDRQPIMELPRPALSSLALTGSAVYGGQ